MRSDRIKNEIEKELVSLGRLIAKQMNEKRITNTGNAIMSLRISETTLYGASYIYQLIYGREPGKFPPVQNIRDWVETKLGITEENERNSVAYLVGRKIANYGTDIYDFPAKGIELNELLIEFKRELVGKIAVLAKLEAKTFINEKYS